MLILDPAKHAPTPRAAQLLGKPRGTLRQWRLRGVGPPWFKIVGRVYYDLEALRDWAKRNGVRL